MAVIELDHVTKRFAQRSSKDGLLVLSDVTFSVADHEFVCLLGRSGSGKTTLLNLISGLESDYSGSIKLVGAPGQRASGARVRIGYVFQEPRLLPWMSVLDNILFSMRRSPIASGQREAHAMDWIERVGLTSFHRAYPHELSGGMQQRAAIARAFAINPDVLLMDEPFSGLDEFTGRAMREELLVLWRETRKTVVFVTHHCFEACYLADRILVLGSKPGRVAVDLPNHLPRPRDYESSEMFQLSNRVTKLVIGQAAESAPIQPDAPHGRDG